MLKDVLIGNHYGYKMRQKIYDYIYFISSTYASVRMYLYVEI